MHNQNIILKRVRPRAQSTQIEQPENKNKKTKLVPSVSTTFFWDTDTLNITFKHLFGRGSEHYLGGTQLSDLRNLMSFGVCSIYANKLVCEYAKELASEFQKDFLLFHQECFKIGDPEDGIKAFMINNLQDNKSYLIQLSMRYQAKFSEILALPFIDLPTQKALANNIDSLQTVLKTNKANGLLDAFLADIYNILSDGDTIWLKKSHAICLTIELCKINCFAYTENKNQILIEIIKRIIDLLSHEQLRLVNNAMHLLGVLAPVGILKELSFGLTERIIVKAEELLGHNEWQSASIALRVVKDLAHVGMIKELHVKVIERIVVKAENLLSHNQEQVSQNAQYVIIKLAQVGMLKELHFKVTERIVVKAENLLSHKQEIISQNALFLIGALAEAGLIKYLPFALIEKIIFKVNNLLDYNQEPNHNSIARAITVIGLLARAGIIKRVYFELIERIIVKLENLLGPNHNLVVTSALLTIGYVLETEILNRSSHLIGKISIKAEGLLDNAEWGVVVNAIFVMLLINKTNPETVLNKITESQINTIYKGILETNMPVYGNENLIKIFTFLYKHESQTIQNMSLELVSHISSL